MTVFTALPGTLIADLDKSTSPPSLVCTVVIGWSHVQGSRAYPITALNSGGMTEVQAVIHGDTGFVTHPSRGLTFASVEEWMAYMKTAKPGKIIGTARTEPYADEDEPEPSPDLVMPDDDAEATSADFVPVVFGKKAHKSKSYWSMPADGVVFEVDGGDPYPIDERVEKIKRDDFAEFKRQGWAVGLPTAEEPAEDRDEEIDDLI